MKPKKLKHPHTWEERKPCIQDFILWVPEHYYDLQSLTFPGWDHPDIFGNDQPVHIEFCSGNGHWLIEKAKENPHLNWVGVEKRFDRVQKIWSKKENEGIKNLFVICGEAFKASTNYIPEASVSGVFINFPDPWPKEKHAKNRLIQPYFTEELSRILVEKSKVSIVTDDVPYSEQIIQVLNQSKHFLSDYSEPYFRNEREGYGSSWFEELWRGHGKSIRYHQFSKRES